MRDNALAAELIRQGHEVTLLPIYTPTRTDETNVSHPRVFFNGISVYLQQSFAPFRKMPGVLDKLLDSKWLLKMATARSIPVNPKLLGSLTVSMLQGEHGVLKREFEKLAEWIRTQPKPDIVDLPYSLLLGMAKPLKEALQRPVCCTLQGEDLFLQSLVEPYRSEALQLIRSAADHIDVFIASSEYYAAFMARYLSIPAEKIRIIPLGISLEGHAPAQRSGGVFRIGYMARIAPEKGLHLLVDAYCRLRQQAGLGPAMLEAAGYLPPEHKSYLRAAERKMKDNGLASEFRYHGEVDRSAKIHFLQSLDLLSVPSTYDEPKGIFVFEAMANGVPVVQPRRGAYPEIIERTQGGLLVEPDSVESLAEGLRTLWQDGALRERLGSQAYAGVRQHHSITRMAEETLAVYSSHADIEYSERNA
jgi:glycosyltransferase involved in cell wall biosynthesis